MPEMTPGPNSHPTVKLRLPLPKAMLRTEGAGPLDESSFNNVFRELFGPLERREPFKGEGHVLVDPQVPALDGVLGYRGFMIRAPGAEVRLAQLFEFTHQTEISFDKIYLRTTKSSDPQIERIVLIENRSLEGQGLVLRMTHPNRSFFLLPDTAVNEAIKIGESFHFQFRSWESQRPREYSTGKVSEVVFAQNFAPPGGFIEEHRDRVTYIAEDYSRALKLKGSR